MGSIYLWYSVGRSPTLGPTMREAPRPPPALEQPAGRGFPVNVGATRRAPRGDPERRTTARTPAGAAWTPFASPRTYSPHPPARQRSRQRLARANGRGGTPLTRTDQIRKIPAYQARPHLGSA